MDRMLGYGLSRNKEHLYLDAFWPPTSPLYLSRVWLRMALLLIDTALHSASKMQYSLYHVLFRQVTVMIRPVADQRLSLATRSNIKETTT